MPLPSRLAVLLWMQVEHMTCATWRRCPITAAAPLPGCQASECLLLIGICKKTQLRGMQVRVMTSSLHVATFLIL